MSDSTIHLRADTPQQLRAALESVGWLRDRKPVQSADHDWMMLRHPLVRTISISSDGEYITETISGAHANCVVRHRLPDELEPLRATVNNPVASYRRRPANRRRNETEERIA